MNPMLQRTDGGIAQSAPSSLVGIAGVGKAIAYDPLPSGQCGLDDGVTLLAPAREHQYGSAPDRARGRPTASISVGAVTVNKKNLLLAVSACYVVQSTHEFI